jgi:hypothetical protein
MSVEDVTEDNMEGDGDECLVDSQEALMGVLPPPPRHASHTRLIVHVDMV